MSDASVNTAQSSFPEKSNWWAILAMMLGVAALISAELLPVSLLTQMAKELGVTSGIAGQMVSTTATVAMIAGLTLPGLLKRVNRRHLILAFSLMLVISCFVTAAAPNFLLLLAARVLLGAAVGGFWAILSSVTMHLVPQHRVSAAFSIIFSGVSLALVAAAPLGNYLGGIFGWRVVFVGVGIISIAILLLQWFTIPSVQGNNESQSNGMFSVLNRSGVTLAFIGMLLSFTGNQMLYIYMRPYMEAYVHLSVTEMSLAWVFFGVFSFLGATFTGVLAQRALKQILVGMPIAMVVVALTLLAGPKIGWAVYPLIACWGFFGAVLPIIWSTWITRALPDATDSAGGLYSAALQVAAIFGAMVSGTLIDHLGIISNNITTAVVMAVTVAMVLSSLRKKPID